jgi:hypothetical protein
VQVYNTILKVVFLSTSYATIYLIRNQYKHTYDKENDTFRMIFLVVPCFILACFINYYPNPQEVRRASIGWSQRLPLVSCSPSHEFQMRSWVARRFRFLASAADERDCACGV